jgi:hypothetical protein
MRLYVGGVLGGSTAIANLKGCIRGMRFGVHHINLGENIATLDNNTGIFILFYLFFFFTLGFCVILCSLHGYHCGCFTLFSWASKIL